MILIVVVILGFVVINQKKNQGYKTQGYKQITPEKAKRMMETNNNALVVDVRTEQEYSEGHIPGAFLLSLHIIDQEAEKQLPDKGQLLLVYCRSGNRSKQASSKLVALGYTNVQEFGGINGWKYEIEK